MSEAWWLDGTNTTPHSRTGQLNMDFYERRDEWALFLLLGMLIFGAYLAITGYAPR